jgi:hypothetical protein
MFIQNNKYVSYRVIHAELNRVWKERPFDINDVQEWCSIVESRFTDNADTLCKFLQIPLAVESGKALTPCGITRILDVYSDPDDETSVVNATDNGVYLIMPAGYDQDYVFINYVGVPVNEDGEIMILKTHEEACKTYCKMCHFEEAAFTGRFNYNMWQGWDMKFSGQIRNSRYDVFRNWPREKYNELNAIHGNMIPKIGNLVLYHLNFK